jgi:hypothetical protein
MRAGFVLYQIRGFSGAELPKPPQCALPAVAAVGLGRAPGSGRPGCTSSSFVGGPAGCDTSLLGAATVPYPGGFDERPSTPRDLGYCPRPIPAAFRTRGSSPAARHAS